jgi:hypothetical protein
MIYSKSSPIYPNSNGFNSKSIIVIYKNCFIKLDELRSEFGSNNNFNLTKILPSLINFLENKEACKEIWEIKIFHIF